MLLLNILKNKSCLYFVFFLILTLGTVLRFYNLQWGAPFYFHPDERNIASSVTQLRFPTQMNPHFFAYGSFPIYVIYALSTIFTFFKTGFFSSFVSFETAILMSRFLSAVFSMGCVIILYNTASFFMSRNWCLIGAFFATTSVGFIQFAHFGTFEMWITFFVSLLFFVCLQQTKRYTKLLLFLSAVLFGLLVSIKISCLVYIGLPLTTILLNDTKIGTKLGDIFIFLLISLFVFICLSPYVLFDTQSFLDSMTYESSVAIGSLPVFYTGEFFGSVPVLFQFKKIYPFILNPLLTILFVITLISFIIEIVRRKKTYTTLLLLFFFVTFFSQAPLFTKWTRYMIPTLPSIYLITTYMLYKMKQDKYKNILVMLICLFCLLFSFSYVSTVFATPDTRIQASDWLRKSRTSPQAMIAADAYDLGILPFNNISSNISLINFYDLDNTSVEEANKIIAMISSYDYIVMPSQRIIGTRMASNKQFPRGNKFYTLLTQEKAGFHLVYTSACNSLCKLTYLNYPESSFEQTANIFDRPTVTIFKKQKMIDLSHLFLK